MSLHAPFAPRSVDPALELEPSGMRAPDDPLTLSRWLAGILLRWRLILWIIAATLVAAALALVFVPPVYRAQTVFVANSSGGGGGGGVSGALGGSGLAGMASQLGIGGKTDPSESPIFYGHLLESRELLTRLVSSRFPDFRTAAPNDSAPLIDMLRVEDEDEGRRLEKALRELRDNLSTGHDLKTNTVTLIVSLEWPEVAAAVANRATELVKQFNLEQRQSRGRAKRLFLDRRIEESRAELGNAEARLRSFHETNRQFDRSPELRLREGELRRQVDMATDLYLTVQRERESAQLAEMNDAALITIVDAAIPTRRASWPRPFLALATATLVGLLLGVIVAGLATGVSNWTRREPADASLLRLAFAEAWSGIQRLPRAGRRGS